MYFSKCVVSINVYIVHNEKNNINNDIGFINLKSECF